MSKLKLNYTNEQMELAKEFNDEFKALSREISVGDSIGAIVEDLQVFIHIKLAGMELRLRELEGRGSRHKEIGYGGY